MKIGIVRFPGSNCDEDCRHAVTDVTGDDAVYLWHEETELRDADCVILPGGFAHGDYLRVGAMARISPVMKVVRNFALSGGLVIGICNGFQILAESGLLPGALLRNTGEKFVCDWVNLRVENSKTPFTSRYRPSEVIRMPVAHGEGRYYVEASDLKAMETRGQVVFRYCDVSGNITDSANPNGSVTSIAGICNEAGNVMGMMPHPERCCEPILGGVDGLRIFESIREFLRGRKLNVVRG